MTNNYLLQKTKANPTLLLIFVLILNTTALIYYIFFLNKNGYLPSPFLYDKNDTFMDFYNPLYWAYKAGRYLEWKSIYPPLNFLILKLFGFFSSFEANQTAFEIRKVYSFLILNIFFCYFVFPILILKNRNWRVFNKIQLWLIYFIFIFSAPMLFALERGNLIILTILLITFVFSENRLIKLISISILINLKPYFALLLLLYFSKKNWRELVLCIFLTGGIFIATGFILGGDFLAFFLNLFHYARIKNLYSIREIVAMPSSIESYVYMADYINKSNLTNVDSVLLKSLGSIKLLDFLAGSVIVLKDSLILTSLFMLVKKSSKLKDWELLVITISLITNLGIFVGGYTLILYFVCIPFFMRMRYKSIYICLIILLAMPLDMISIYEQMKPHEVYSYLLGDYCLLYWSAGLGSVLRPLINFMILFLLIYEFFVFHSERKSLHLDSANSQLVGSRDGI